MLETNVLNVNQQEKSEEQIIEMKNKILEILKDPTIFKMTLASFEFLSFTQKSFLKRYELLHGHELGITLFYKALKKYLDEKIIVRYKNDKNIFYKILIQKM